MKLASKKRINSKYYKQYDQPQTPYQKLLTSNDVTSEAKQKLTAIYQLLNPFKLRRNIEHKIKNIFDFV
jgi:hypothetical protein